MLDYLIAVMVGSKRTRVKEILHSGLVHLNGRSVTRHDQVVRPVDVVEIREQRAPPTRSLPFDVLFEDAWLLAINKPSGLLTVANRHEKAQAVYPILMRALGVSRERVYIVHRLDLYTSGVLLLAKSLEVQEKITENWGAAKKVYHALVEGLPKPPQRTLTHYLREDERLIVHASERFAHGASKAVMSYRVVKERGDYTLLQVALQTGKKNQIRSQLSAIGYPVAGDAKYGARTNPIGRLCLHASSLTLPHPKTGNQVAFHASLPAGMDV